MDAETQSALDRLGRDIGELKVSLSNFAPSIAALAEAEKSRAFGEVKTSLQLVKDKIENEFAALHKKFDDEIAADEDWVGKVADTVGAELKTPAGIATLCLAAFLAGIATLHLAEGSGVLAASSLLVAPPASSQAVR